MASIRRIVLDILKPHEPELLEFSQQITGLEGVAAANVAVIEVDREVQNVKLTVEGDALDYISILATVRDLGASVHSIDGVSAGEYLICEPTTTSLVRPTWLR